MNNISKKVYNHSTKPVETQYLAGYQYISNVLQFFPTAEGYVNNTVVSGINQYSYVYNYTDHLGNIRLSYKKNGTTLQILEENNYYSFGLKHTYYNTTNAQPNYKYKYNGKEYQDELGLNFYDYGARNYDASIGRFFNVDPLAETSRRWSTYAYCYNNPMRFTDPDGMQADDIVLGKNLTAQQQQQVLGTLQQLTNDKLKLDSTNGKVTIDTKGTENSSKTLSSGTDLISDLISDNNTVTIDVVTTGSTEVDVNPTDATNGVGSDAVVEIDYSQQGDVLTEDSTTGAISSKGTSSEIILGHELVHAQRSMTGIAVDYSKNENFSYNDAKGAKATQNVPTEELNTVGLKGGGTYTENKLRKEQGYGKRISY